MILYVSFLSRLQENSQSSLQDAGTVLMSKMHLLFIFANIRFSANEASLLFLRRPLLHHVLKGRDRAAVIKDIGAG